MRIATDHREAILQTAARLFARKPFHEVLMDDVAENTGIAKGTIYRYFPNKEDLFAALSLRFIEMLTEKIGKLRDKDDPIGGLRTMLVRLMELIETNDDFFRVMQRRECDVWERKSAEFTQHRSAFRDCFAEQIAVAERAGLLACPFGAEVAADMLLGMLRNILRFSSPPPAPRDAEEMVLHVFLNGLSVKANTGISERQPVKVAVRKVAS